MKFLLFPNKLKEISNILIISLKIIILPVLMIGLYYVFFASPIDYQQKEMVRVMYIHVPAAWMSLLIFTIIGIMGIINFIWRIKTCFLVAVSIAEIGALFTFITLVTGSIWGKPIWGTWWVFDARLTSMLLLFLSYVSYLAIISAANKNNDILRAEKPASIFSIIALINVPIVKYSVNIWYSLHQNTSFSNLSSPSIAQEMLKPLIIMFLFFIIFAILHGALKYQIINHKIKNRYDSRSNR